MKIAILGAGALGSVIGAELHVAGAEVILLDKDTAHLSAINERGLQVDWDDRSDHLMIPAMEPENAPQVDLVILLTKTLHSVDALRSISPLISAGACVMTLQNGLGNVETVSSMVPAAQVLFGCTMTPGDMRGPGHVASHGTAYTPFTALVADGPAAELANSLTAAGMVHTPQAMSHVWQKAAFNCAMNATSMLGEGSVGDIASFMGQDMLVKIAEEVLCLGGKEGVSVDKDAVSKQIGFALSAHAQHKPSMLQDFEAGRRTEVEALNGYVARRGKELGIDVPLNTLLADLVRMKESRKS